MDMWNRVRQMKCRLVRPGCFDLPAKEYLLLKIEKKMSGRVFTVNVNHTFCCCYHTGLLRVKLYLRPVGGHNDKSQVWALVPAAFQSSGQWGRSLHLYFSNHLFLWWYLCLCLSLSQHLCFNLQLYFHMYFLIYAHTHIYIHFNINFYIYRDMYIYICIVMPTKTLYYTHSSRLFILV